MPVHHCVFVCCLSCMIRLIHALGMRSAVHFILCIIIITSSFALCVSPNLINEPLIHVHRTRHAYRRIVDIHAQRWYKIRIYWRTNERTNDNVIVISSSHMAKYRNFHENRWWSFAVVKCQINSGNKNEFHGSTGKELDGIFYVICRVLTKQNSIKMVWVAHDEPIG